MTMRDRLEAMFPDGSVSMDPGREVLCFDPKLPLRGMGCCARRAHRERSPGLREAVPWGRLPNYRAMPAKRAIQRRCVTRFAGTEPSGELPMSQGIASRSPGLRSYRSLRDRSESKNIRRQYLYRSLMHCYFNSFSFVSWCLRVFVAKIFCRTSPPYRPLHPYLLLRQRKLLRRQVPADLS